MKVRLFTVKSVEPGFLELKIPGWMVNVWLCLFVPTTALLMVFFPLRVSRDIASFELFLGTIELLLLSAAFLFYGSWTFDVGRSTVTNKRVGRVDTYPMNSVAAISINYAGVTDHNAGIPATYTLGGGVDVMIEFKDQNNPSLIVFQTGIEGDESKAYQVGSEIASALKLELVDRRQS